LLNINDYFLANVQFSSSCPYHCEFCDIPELYGNSPRMKTPEQVVAELDAMRQSGNLGVVYFVDDNFVGDRRAAMKLLPHLIDWQKRNGYPIQFACEATLNLAQSPKLLEMMREAYFCTIFCGIETPEPNALHAISKDQNLSMNLGSALRQYVISMDYHQRFSSSPLLVTRGVMLGSPLIHQRVGFYMQVTLTFIGTRWTLKESAHQVYVPTNG
jgi:Radical SAM superfamily